jgi:hypothetical protein
MRPANKPSLLEYIGIQRINVYAPAVPAPSFPEAAAASFVTAGYGAAPSEDLEALPFPASFDSSVSSFAAITENSE